jgi:hypothetical protein
MEISSQLQLCPHCSRRRNSWYSSDRLNIPEPMGTLNAPAVLSGGGGGGRGVSLPIVAGWAAVPGVALWSKELERKWEWVWRN